MDKTGVTHNKGIAHIESLPHSRFIETIRHISDFTISEKLDGSNLVFGFEHDGAFYTSRESKNGKRLYDVNDYSDNAADNGFKSAHAALRSIEPLLKHTIRNGEAVEVEILFGRQPNAIVYGSNYIAFLRMLINEDEDSNQTRIQHLGDLLSDKVTTINVPITTTLDGISIKTEETTQVWKFASVSYVDTQKFSKVNISKEITTFERWLSQMNPILNMTNAEIIEVNLMSVPKDIRSTAKVVREDTIKTANEKFKLPIKERFLDEVLRTLKPALRDVTIEEYEDFGVEGVVLLNPETLEQLKIVDKDVFTTINQFNHAVRNQIKQTIKGRAHFPSMLPKDTDVFGDMLKRIADVIGIEDLGDYMKIKRVLRKYDGESIQQTAANIGSVFKSLSLPANKKEIIMAIREGLLDLDVSLDFFQENWKKYQFELKTGKRVKYTSAIHDRTLMAFAETRKDMQGMLTAVENADSLSGIVIALYGKQLKGIN